MSKNLYIASTEPHSGKSLVVLGVMELLSGRIQNLSFFRPLVQQEDDLDRDIALVRARYGIDQPYDSFYAATYEEARGLSREGRFDELLKRVLGKYKELERRSDFVLCEGTDFTDVGAAFEFEFNAVVANHLGCPVLLVINGRGKSCAEVGEVIYSARNAFTEQGCAVIATIVNRVDEGDRENVLRELEAAWTHADPVFVLPEEPTLGSPTVAEIADAIGAELILGESSDLERDVLSYTVAAMQLPNFLDRVGDGSLVITPGDRADLILGSLATVGSANYPNIAAILLTGGLKPPPQVRLLLEESGFSRVPVLSAQEDTFATALRVNSVRAGIAAENERKIATSLGLFETCVDMPLLERSIELAPSAGVTPIMFEYEMIEQAKSQGKRIVLPEGADERILRAAEILMRRRVAQITLLGNVKEIRQAATSLGVDLGAAEIVDPSRSPWHGEFAETYHNLRQHKGITYETAADTMLDANYFGTMMVHKGLVDGMVSGAAHTTAHTIRPSFEIIKTKKGCVLVSSVFLMCLADRVLVYGDCAVNPDPTAEQLADIAGSSAETAKMFGIEPRVAMLSYSSGQSGKGECVEKVRDATQRVRERWPELKVEGPIQYDAAIDANVARSKMPGSEVAGRATVLVFPDLNTGNNTYKAVQRSAGAVAIGPVLQGLNKPVNDLSRGCTVTDVVNTVAITAILAQVNKEPRHESACGQLGELVH